MTPSTPPTPTIAQLPSPLTCGAMIAGRAHRSRRLALAILSIGFVSSSGLVVGPAAASTSATIAIGDAAAYEGDAGSTPATVVVTLSDLQSADVFVDYAVVAGTAAVGIGASDGDVVNRRGRVRFKAGRTSASITTRIIGDTSVEGDESFSVVLANVSLPNIALRDNTAAVTIRDDDPPAELATVAVSDTTLYEGDSGLATAKITVTLSAPQGKDLVVTYTTADGSAIGGKLKGNADFVARTGQVRIRAGRTSAQIAVKVRGDTTGEAGESFGVIVNSTSGAEVAVPDGAATVTLSDDDPSPLPEVPTALAGTAGPQNRYLTASWDAPSSGATPTGYDLEVTRSGTSNVLTDVTSPLVFGCGLASVTDTCTMRIRSFNASGTSAWSAPVVASTWAPPAAPPNLAAVATTVSWEVPGSDQPVLDYWVFRSLDEGTTWTQVTTTTNQHAAAGCSICLIRVQARSSVGFGPFATIVLNYSPPSPPAAPTNLIVTRDSADPALLHISWTAPPTANPPVDFYDVTINDFVFPFTIRDNTTTNVDFRQRNPVQVFISVVARNAAGVSPPFGVLVP